MRPASLSISTAVLLVAAVSGAELSRTRPAREPAERVAVLPVSALAASASSCERIRRQLARILQEGFDLELVARDQTDLVVRHECGPPANWWDCLGQDHQLVAIGRKLRATKVVTARLAAMGDKRVLRLRVAEVDTGRMWAEVVDLPPDPGKEPTVLRRFLLLHERVFPRHDRPEPAGAPPKAAWYKRWETWVLAGAGVALVAGAVTLGVVLGTNGADQPWDIRRSLP